jgi:hypothetical protein
LHVQIFDEDVVRRLSLASTLLQIGGHRDVRPANYTTTLWWDIRHPGTNLRDELPGQLRRKLRKMAENISTHVAPIGSERYLVRLRELHQRAYCLHGGCEPRLDFRAVMRDSRTQEHSILLGVFLADKYSPQDLVGFNWSRLNGDYAHYEAGGTERSLAVRGLAIGEALMWNVALWAGQRGAQWLDLGGLPPPGGNKTDPMQGIARFKRQFTRTQIIAAEEFVFFPSRRCLRPSRRISLGVAPRF